MPEEGLTAGGLRRTVAELVEEDPESITDEMNLFEAGLDSIVLMQLAGRWRRSGVDIDFAELARQPTIGAWAVLLRQKAGTSPGEEPVAGRDPAGAGPEQATGELFPLALMQHAYWVGREDNQRFGGVGAHLYVEFDGTGVQPQRLERAIERLVARHDMLRVRITDNGEQQVLPPPGGRELTVHDLREMDAEQVERRLCHTREKLSHQLLDIENGEVFSIALSLLPGGRTRLHVDVDMVAADAISYRVVLADLARLYGDTGVRLPPIRYSYRSYLSVRPELRRARASRAAEFWRRRLPELPGAPELPLVPAGGTPRASRRAFRLPPHLRAALAGAARSRGVTPAMTLTTAFAEVLGAWSAEPRFLLNLPIFDREQVHPDIGRVVGDFTSSVLLEVDLTEPATFLDRVRRVQARAHADTAHAGYSGVEVLRELSRRTGEQVIAPVVFTSGLNFGELFDEAVRRHFGDPGWIISQGPQVLLDAQVTEVDGGLLVNWDVRENEFAPGVVDAMFEAFERLVRLAADDGPAWDAPVGDQRPAGQRAVRARVNDTTVPGSPRPLHEDFFALSRRSPNAPAVLGGAAGPLSYAELAQRALRVAAALRARGVGRGDTVGVTLPKGPDQIVAVLGVLAAGGTYVPIGVEQPAARAERIAGLAGVRLVVTGQDGPGRLALATALAGHEPLAGPCGCGPEQAAYLLFTSGSTGEPKGVEVAHQAAVNTVDDLVARFELGPSDRTLGVSALDFDLSVFDIFAPLSVGGAVVVVGEDARRDAQHWAELIRGSAVTVLNCVPALLDMILTTGVALGGSLRLVLLGGDWVGADLPGRVAEAVPGCRFAGLGGTTETAIHSTVCEVGPVPAECTSVPYGRPLRNVRLRVVDAQGRDVPDWVPGELWIGGAGVALRYRGDPEGTAERFVTHEGQRWYRTGDRARYWPDGTVEFLGRRDNQVKLRGMRIELGEVDAALLADRRVHSAVTVLTRAATPALVAAVVPVADADPEQIRAGLRKRLAPHMVPERLLVLGELPLTRNGKIDRRALEVLAEQTRTGDGGTARVAPRTMLERAITRIWASVLPVGDAGRIGVTESLFALGGDSVLATAIVARLREELDIPAVSVRMLFAAPTIAGLTERILAAEQTPARLERVAGERLTTGSPDPAPGAPRAPATGYPLSPGQRRMWFLQQLNPSSVAYNIAAAFTLSGPLDEEILRESLVGVVRRHEILRTTYRADQTGVPAQFIHADLAVPWSAHDLSDVPQPELEERIDRIAVTEARHVFDLATEAPLRVTLLRSGSHVRTLVLVAHHIAWDDESWEVFFGDLLDSYTAVRRGVRRCGTERAPQYLDFSVPDTGSVAAELAFWRQRLTPPPEPVQLPGAHGRPVAGDEAGGQRSRVFASELPARVRELATRAAASPFMVLLAAFTGLLHRCSATTDVALGTPVVNRDGSHADRALGYFGNMVCLRTDPCSSDTFLELVEKVRTVCSGAFSHQRVDFERVVGELNPHRADGVPALVNAMFAARRPAAAALCTEEVTATRRALHNGSAQFPLSVTAEISDREITVEATYLSSVLCAGSADQLLRRLELFVSEAVRDPERAIGHLDLVSGDERRRVLVDWNDTATDVPDVSFAELFAAQVAQRPAASAVVLEDQVLSYAQLDRAANRLARLLAGRGAGPEAIVALALPRSVQLVVAMVAVAKTGAAYLPLDLDHPPDRIDFVLADAEPVLVLTTSDLAGRLPARRVPRLVLDDTATGAPPARPDTGLGATNGARSRSHAAYVIYTSGSTGRPKGVVVSCAGLASLVATAVDRLGVGPGSRILQFASISFDVAVWDLCMALGTGAALVVVPEHRRVPGPELTGYAHRHGVTHMILPPSLVAALPPECTLPAGATLLLGTETVPPALVTHWAAHLRVFAAYGLTETTVNSTLWPVPPGWAGSTVPIGTPDPNTRAYVLDPALRPSPPGTTGELYLAGDGLARGYLHRPGLTAARFVANPYGPAGTRLYRTGDLVRHRPDGTLEFCGRTDDQIKIRGHRVEPGDIETTLARHPAVCRAVVVLRPGSGGPDRLVACCVLEGAGLPAPSWAELRDWLRDRLPDYLVPAAGSVVAALPLTPAGKIDRERVLVLAEEQSSAEATERGTAPAAGSQQLVADLWQQVLPEARITAHDNFFDLGGHSILLVKVRTLLAQRLQRDVALVDLYRHPTVASLAAHCDTAGRDTAGRDTAGRDTAGTDRAGGSSELDLVAARARRQRRARSGRAAGSPGREPNHRA